MLTNTYLAVVMRNYSGYDSLSLDALENINIVAFTFGSQIWSTVADQVNEL